MGVVSLNDILQEQSILGNKYERQHVVEQVNEFGILLIQLGVLSPVF